MSTQPVISTTSQWRTIVGTLDEALALANTQVRQVDAWAGASISINPVMRDHQTGTFQWEVMVSGVAVTVGDTTGQTMASPHPSPPAHTHAPLPAQPPTDG